MMSNPTNKSLQQDKQSSSTSNPENDISLLKLSSFSNVPRKRIKRSRSYKEPSFEPPMYANQLNSRPFEAIPPLPNEGLDLTNFSQNCFIKGTSPNKHLQGSESKKSSSLCKKYDKKPRKRVFQTQGNLNNIGSVGSTTMSLALNNSLTSFGRKNIKDLQEGVKLDDFSKEIDDAITRIESLIPALQKLVSCVHGPHHKGVDTQALPGITSSYPDTQLSNFVQSSEQCKFSEDGRSMLFNQANQTVGKNNPAVLPVMQGWNVDYVGYDVPSQMGFLKNVSPNCGFAQNGDRGVDHWITNNLLPSFHGNYLSNETIFRNSELKPQPSVPAVEVSNFMRSNRASNLGKMVYKQSHAHIKGKTGVRKNLSLKKLQLSDTSSDNHQESEEETSWDSLTYTHETSQESNSNISSSETYSSTSFSSTENFESEVLDAKQGEISRRKHYGASECNSGSDTSSYYSNQDQYSDVGTSSSYSSRTKSHSLEHGSEQVKGGGRFKRLKKKLGMIFHHHHHHHHHHHYSEDEESKSFWKQVRKMFHHPRKRSDVEKKPKVGKSSKAMIKHGQNRKKRRHFPALVGGLMKHFKRSKKSKKAQDNLKRLGNGNLGGKKKAKKLQLLPKNHGKKVGVKIFNKGRIKLGISKKKKRQLTAAKMILKQ